MNYINLKNNRINLDHVIQYYVTSEKRLGIELVNGKVFDILFKNSEEVNFIIKWLDQKCQVKNPC